MQLLNGIDVVESEIQKLKGNVVKNTKAVIISVGNDPSSAVYINNKIKLCERLGIKIVHEKFDENITQMELETLIKAYNIFDDVHGIMMQLPVPKHIDSDKISNLIDKNKDIDCFNPYNLGNVFLGKEDISPCTPKGIFTLLSHYNIKDFKGKKVCIVGRSNIVGKPLANMFINRGATVTICNSKTNRRVLKNHILNSDIFVTAIGKLNYFNEEFFGYDIWNLDNIIAIDVSINLDENKKLNGDISKNIYSRFRAITPVPNGIGRTTVLELCRNIINCRILQKS